MLGFIQLYSFLCSVLFRDFDFVVHLLLVVCLICVFVLVCIVHLSVIWFIQLYLVTFGFILLLVHFYHFVRCHVVFLFSRSICWLFGFIHHCSVMFVQFLVLFDFNFVFCILYCVTSEKVEIYFPSLNPTIPVTLFDCDVECWFFERRDVDDSVEKVLQSGLGQRTELVFHFEDEVWCRNLLSFYIKFKCAFKSFEFTLTTWIEYPTPGSINVPQRAENR